MNRTIQSLALAAALGAVVACAAGSLQGEPGSTVPVDILVVPPSVSGLPAQLIRDVPWVDLQDGTFDLSLTRGSEFSAIVATTGGQPLGNAAVRVTLQGAGTDKVVFSNADGLIALPLGSGNYDIEVTPDRITDPSIPPRTFRDVTIGEGGGPVSTDLTMLPGIKIRGTVISGGGAAVGWRVSARSQADDAPSTYADTTLAGFEIFVSSTGSWMVQITPPNGAGQPIAKVPLDVAGETTFGFTYPAFAQHSLSGTLSPADGALGIDLSAVAVRARATLVGPDGDNASYSFDQRTFTDSLGAFSMPVLQGVYTISIEPGLDIAYSHRVLSLVDIQSDTLLPATQTQLFPTVAVAGRVSGGNGEPTPDAQVRFLAADGSAYQFSGRTDPDGRYMVQMDVGDYDVLVLPAPQSGHVRHATSTTVNTGVTDLDYTVDVGHEVHGRVRGPDPEASVIPNATVLALDPVTAAPIGSADSVSDAGGEWALSIPVYPSPTLQ